jgi:hypothetical protein
MTPGVWAAIVTSLTSLTVAVFSLVFQRKGAREEREEKKRSAAKVVLDKYRGPLLVVATDLGRRIHHIRHQEFYKYAASASGHDGRAKLTTLFRLAQYFGWCEILRTEVQVLHFEHEADTSLVAELIGAIHWACSSDAVDDGSRGSLWAEEQRGVGELMVARNGGSLSTCGYARFVDEYGRRFASWMDGIASFVLGKEAPDSHRLRLVQWGLFGLVNELDEEHAYTGEEEVEEEWMDQAREELYARQELYVQEKFRREQEKFGKDSKPRLTSVEFNIIDSCVQAVDPRRPSRRGHRSREPVD